MFYQKPSLDVKEPFGKFTEAELKDLDDGEDYGAYLRGQSVEAWYCIVMRMSHSMYTENKSWKTFDNDQCISGR
jgi:hypothetical protein